MSESFWKHCRGKGQSPPTQLQHLRPESPRSAEEGRGEATAVLTLARSKVYFLTKVSNSGITAWMPSRTCSTKSAMAKTRLQQALGEDSRMAAQQGS